MKYIYINRDKDVKRREIFLEKNFHVENIERFSAVDKQNINKNDLIGRGILNEDCIYGNAAIANALSHIYLWSGVIESGKSACIFEDDAIICKNFTSECKKVIDSLGEDWDIVLFGNNFDASLYLCIVPGVLDGVVSFNSKKFAENADNFSDITIDAKAVKLLEAFGLCGYAISPRGAGKLMNSIIPIRDMTFNIDIVGGLYKNGSLDNFLCAAYKQMNAYCCVPPLCVSKNDKSISTMWNGEDFYH
ncbi:glycosyltransferase [Gluconacetobacter johannae DSM 13595]|uniref:Glycosyl transferase family 25 domain-containing protein n=1 Tax=Gluconacetobacter johannae TaxID=112140 RepID=A0A7W4P373_9PROT|nr:glycosyltransferase family 25 protein [Gluconacetobacter johannae]MBB2175737.1 hypothetical protein [Gluconacetobacter johannae]GBQ83037.1 glycosyltransferase [Gluconacetobacter johannae DSM 13595]